MESSEGYSKGHPFLTDPIAALVRRQTGADPEKVAEVARRMGFTRIGINEKADPPIQQPRSDRAADERDEAA